MGKWNVRNRRPRCATRVWRIRRVGRVRRRRLPGRVTAPGGLGNEDVFCTEYGERVRRDVVPASSIPRHGRWSIFTGRTARRPRAARPAGGRHRSSGAHGESFEGDDAFGGRPIRVMRFAWRRATSATPRPRWEQAFSHSGYDGGTDVGDELGRGLSHAGTRGSGVSALRAGRRRDSREYTPRGEDRRARSRRASRSTGMILWR